MREELDGASQDPTECQGLVGFASGEQSAAQLIHRGPDFEQPAQFGALSRWLRRAAFRFQRHLYLFYQSVLLALLDADWRAARQIASLEAATRGTEEQARQFEARLGELELHVQEEGSQGSELRRIGRVEAESSARMLVMDRRIKALERTLASSIGRERASTAVLPRVDRPSTSAETASVTAPTGDVPPMGTCFYDDKATALSSAEIKQLIDQQPLWYHQIELGPGLITPGFNTSRRTLSQLDDLGLPLNCSGLRVLDIGCRDGYFSFALEQRGAEVLGIDYESPTKTGFSIAARVLGSRSRYLVDNVYDLRPERHGRFDLILFLGVLYHLRNPMLALDRIRSVASDDAMLFVETEVARDSLISTLPVPAWQFFPGDSLNSDQTNKWAPNEFGLRAVLKECEFEVLYATSSTERGYAVARACTDHRLEFFRDLDAGRMPSAEGQKD